MKKFKTFLCITIFNFLFFNLYAQCPPGGANAGTVTVNNDGGTDLPFVVCFGDTPEVSSNNDVVLPPGPNPGIMYGFYSCPPSDPNPSNDPCWTGWYWTGDPYASTNDGDLTPFGGQNSFWIAPIAADRVGVLPNHDANNDDCVDVGTGIMFTYLNELIINETAIDECMGEVTLTIEGGYAELFPGIYNVSYSGGGSMMQSGANGETITITGLVDGDSYALDVVNDGAGCTASFSGGPITQEILMPTLSYSSVCYGGTASPTDASPPGGTFDFVTPPGDGASIDPSTGEIMNAQMDYDIIYTVTGSCGDFSITTTLTVMPQASAPTVASPFLFCENEGTDVIPVGTGDFFSLYDGEFSMTPLSTGGSFTMLSLVTPDGGPVTFYVSQTTGVCESARVSFTVEILSQSPPNGPLEYAVCEGESVTISPETSHNNAPAEFNFYDDAGLSSLLGTGETYTFSPAGSGSIFITENNRGCMTEPLEVSVVVNLYPTAFVGDYTCDDVNNTYSVDIFTTDGDDIQISSGEGTVLSNFDESFVISDVPSGSDLFLDIIGVAPTFCTSDLIVPGFECACQAPDAPSDPTNLSICSSDPFPELSVTAPFDTYINWYDAAVGGTLLLDHSFSYTPSSAGTYYAESVATLDDCPSLDRTAVTLTINPMLVLVSVDTTCSLDLQSYTVDFEITNAESIQVSVGMASGSGGNFTVAGIPTGTNLTYTAFNTDMSCTLGPLMVNSPSCPCPPIDTLVLVPDTMICDGDPIPELSVMASVNQVADWYDAAVAGNLLASNSLVFTPLTPGVYYVEARDTINNCVSRRDSITITSNPLPAFSLISTTCAADLLTYTVSISTTNTDVVMPSIGTLVDDGSGNFSITNIPAGTPLDFTLTNNTTTCSDMFTIVAPDCSCMPVNAPQSAIDTLICTGDAIPTFEMTVDALQTIDWYDAATGGTLLLSGNTSFTPTIAGTYYAEARVIADGCTSTVRTPAILTIETTPTLVSTMPACAADLQSYTVDLQIDDAATLTIVGTGTISNNGGGSFTVSGIPIGENLIYTAFNASGNCSFGPGTVVALECPCPVVMAPIVSDTMICDGDPIPTLEVVAGMNETIDWYDAASGGTLLLGNSLTFTPTLPGTYFLETRNTINNCVSERVSITITRNPLPSVIINSSVCAADRLTYSVSITVANAGIVLADVGSLIPDVDDPASFDIIGIPAGVDLNLLLSNSVTGCELSELVPAQDCNCAIVNAPVSLGDISICSDSAIPTLVANAEIGQVVNWYDAAVGGTLLLANSNTFTPTMAGTYFAEAQITADGCTSERTAITLEINTQPVLVMEQANCAPDLLTYTVELQITGAITLDNDIGTLVDNTNGSFTISDIPAGMNLTYTAFNVDSTCTLGPVMVTAPDCSCPVIAMPVPDAASQAICEGEAIPVFTVTVGADQTADWYDAAVGGNLELGASLTFTPTASDTVYVEARDTITNCISERVAVSLMINPIPSFVVTQNSCAANLETYQLIITVANANEVNATMGTVVDNADGTFAISAIPAGQDVQISLLNTETNCEFSDMVTALDCSCPNMVVPVPDQANYSICEGETIPIFTVSVEANQTADWYDAPVDGNLELGGSLTFTPTASGTLYVEARDPVTGCRSERIAIALIINPVPSFVVSENNCANNLQTYQVVITVTNTDVVNASTGTVVDNADGTFTISAIPAGEDVEISLLNNQGNCDFVEMVTAPDCSCPVIAMPVPDAASQAICEGEAIPVFTVTVGANQTADWYDAAVGGNLELGASLTFTPTASDTVYVEARDTITNCISERVAVSLVINPIPSFVVTQNSCADNLQTYQVIITVANANEVNATMGTVVDNADGTFTISAIPAGGDIEISLLNTETNCEFSDMVIAPDCSCPEINAPLGLNDLAICQGEAIPSFEATVDADQTVDWYDAPSGGNQILAANTTLTPTAAGTFYAEARNTITGCISSTRTAVNFTINENPILTVSSFVLPTCNEEDGIIELEATGGLAPYVYQLNNEAFQNNPLYSNLAASNYDLIVEDENACRDSLTQNLVSPEDVFADAGNTMELTCEETVVTLDGSASDQGTNIVYQWLAPDGNPIPDATTNQLDVEVGGVYTLMVSNTVSGCERTSEVLVTENNELLNVDAGEQQNLTCDSETANLVGSVEGGGDLAFQWSASQGGHIIGEQNGLSVLVDSTGLYHLNVINRDNGCPGSDSVMVVEVLPEDLDVAIEATSPPCLGDATGSISVQSNNPDATLLFSLNDSPFTASTVYSNLVPGNYILHIQDAQGCLSDSLISIEQGTEILLDIPGAVETPGEFIISLGDSVLLEAETNLDPSDLALIQWSGGALLSCDTCLNTYTHNLRETTLFTLQLVDSLGCMASDDIRVFVDRRRHIFVPNAFSPNGDDSNESLMVFGGNDVLNIKSFRIFDRWGEIVFEAEDFLPNDPNTAWNGRAGNNEPLNAAVYVYVLEVDFVDGETEIFAGDIVLLK